MEYIPLHVHSNFSLLQGTFSVRELVREAQERGLPAVALTDTNGLYGALEFYRAAREAGVKPLVGAEIVWGAQQCVLLARNRAGYENLCRVVSERRLAGTPHYVGFLHACGRRDEAGAFDVAASIAADPRGLVALTACAGLLRRLAGVLPPGRLYAELRADTPHSFETRCPALRGDGPGASGGHLHDVATELDIPRAATTNANMLRRGDRAVHEVLSAIRENTMLQDMRTQPRLLADRNGRLMTAREVAAHLPGAEDALRNTRRIAEMCNLELDLDALHFPRADLPDGESPARRLRQVALAGARRRYGEPGPAVLRRIERELDVIEKLDFCDYFLVVHEISQFAERRGIPHVGRGSAGNSVVSYCLGISAVDPMAFNLYFERFLNEHRTDVPDIDIDFCWRRRDEVIDYVYRRYGADRVAMVSTHCTLRARSAFRDVARVMDLPLDDIDALSRRLPHHAVGSIEEAMDTFPEMADFPIDQEPWSTVVRTALRVDGYVRHLGVHLGGLVIADRPLTRYTALEDSTKGIVVTQYEMDSIEGIGLVKMDILGQRSLSIVDEAARDVEQLRGVELDLDKLPEGDERTAAVLRHGRTMGCFQIESPGMRQLLQMLHARDIMGLIQALSLIRPGPSSSGMKQAFIRRMRGREPVTYAAAGMERALEGTYGVMLYQEDILRVAQEVAGFTLAQGDELRKAISKNRSREAVARFREQFLRGAADNGVPGEVARAIWEQIKSFAAYSYCKAHACTYGHISYQATYLKAHWPAEFIASVIANKAGFYDPRTYFEEARRFNVSILPPCVNHSAVETRPDPGPEPAIRPGLEFVKSLRAATIRRILEHRAARPFTSLMDLHVRARPNRTEMENLVLSGALDSLGHSRPTLLMQSERLPKNVPPEGRLFEASPNYCAGPDVPAQPPYSTARRVLLELRTLGFSHSGHALDAWSQALESCPRLTPSYRIPRCRGRRIHYAGWLVTSRRALTRGSRYMRFLTLEDRHGVTEIVMFPDVYRRCGKRITGAGVYLVRGRVKEQNGATSIVAEHVEPLPSDV